MASARNSRGQVLPGTHWRKPAVFRDREYLLAEYVVAQRSSADIAAEHGVGDTAILFWLTRHAIPRRTVSQARAVKHWGLAGESNGMFGRTGPSNPRYVDGSSPERQRVYSSAQWTVVARDVLERDGHKCLRCSAGRKLVFHHVRPWAGNPEHRLNPANIVTLCQKCHLWVHSRANAAKEWLA
jgi:hypothetical protein